MKHLVLLIAMSLPLLSGCRTKYVSVPEYHTEYVSRTDSFLKTDSVYMKDSVFIVQRDDTVFCNKVVYKERYHNIYKVKTDSIFKTDSVSVPYPVVRELSKSEQRLISIGKCTIVIAVLSIAAGAFALWRRNK